MLDQHIYELVFYSTRTRATGWLTASLARSPQEVIAQYEDMLDSDEVAIGVECGDRAWRLTGADRRLVEVSPIKPD